jgi:hypothetical protein
MELEQDLQANDQNQPENVLATLVPSLWATKQLANATMSATDKMSAELGAITSTIGGGFPTVTLEGLQGAIDSAPKAPMVKAIVAGADVLMNTATTRAIIAANKNVIADVAHGQNPADSMEAGAKGVARGVWKDVQSMGNDADQLADMLKRRFTQQDWKKAGAAEAKDILVNELVVPALEEAGLGELATVLSSTKAGSALVDTLGNALDDVAHGKNPSDSLKAGGKKALNALPEDLVAVDVAKVIAARPETKAVVQVVSEKAKEEVKKVGDEAKKVVEEVKKDPLGAVAKAVDATTPSTKAGKAAADAAQKTVDKVAQGQDPTGAVKTGLEDVASGAAKDAKAVGDTAKAAVDATVHATEKAGAAVGNTLAHGYNESKNALGKLFGKKK